MIALLITSPARRSFKRQLGNANHLIITALVGLDAIERGLVTEAPESLHAVWSPKDAVASARRSRRLILDMALVKAIDAIDIYIQQSVRKPRLVQEPTLLNKIHEAGLRISRKLDAVHAHYQNLEPILVALVWLMVAWRHKGAHSEADDGPLEAHRETIKANAETISNRFRGLDSELLLAGYDADRQPSFKEVASFINAAHHYIAELDAAQLSALDQEPFLKELIWTAASFGKRDDEAILETRARHLRSIWGRATTEREGYVRNFLRQHGMSFDVGAQSSSMTTFSDELLAKVVDMSPNEVRDWIQLGQT